MYNLVFISLGIGIIQSVIFALLTFQKQKKSPSDWLLILWFLSFCLHFTCIILVDLSAFSMYLILAKCFLLLYGPFLWFYALAAYSNTIKRYQLFHLTPFLISSLIGFLFFDWFVGSFNNVLVLFKILSMLLYPIFVLYWVHKKMKNFKQQRADGFNLLSRWINWLCYLMLLNGLFGLLHVLGDVTLVISFSEVLDIITYVVMITIMGYLGLKHGIMFSYKEMRDISNKKSYESSPLSKNKKDDLALKVQTYFEQSEDFLDTQFSLQVLSDNLQAPKHHLSEVINVEMQTTFYDLVNSKRVAFAIQKLQKLDELGLTIEGIGYESGFNTKSAFYHHFKQQMGKTPGQYRKENLS